MTDKGTLVQRLLDKEYRAKWPFPFCAASRRQPGKVKGIETGVGKAPASRHRNKHINV